MRGIAPRLIPLAGVTLLAAGFAILNGAEKVTLRLGIATLKNVPLPVVVLTAVVIGMLIVFGVGLRADIRTRRMLRRYREALESRPREGGPD